MLIFIRESYNTSVIDASCVIHTCKNRISDASVQLLDASLEDEPEPTISASAEHDQKLFDDDRDKDE
ncbi:MAG: hypothetical protein HYV32_03800 [Candidatus Kerfeldbacteria bacterium]|nr:hypothetical protein [Candidatus Kerfeldbacteria bacterium]